MKDFKTKSKFRGYESDREPTNIQDGNFAVLVSPSKNCYVTTEGVVQNREGITTVGNKSSATVTSAWTWNNNRNTELPLRTTDSKLQVFYDSD